MPANNYLGIMLLIFIPFYILTKSASASYITIDTNITAEITRETGNITLTIANSGDESAYSVQPVMLFQDRILNGDLISSLKPEDMHTWRFSFQPDMSIDGEYPLILKTYYSDANRYRFSALTIQSIVLKSSMQSAIIGTIHYTKSLPMTIKVEDMQIKRNPLLKDSIFISLTLLLIVLSGAYIYKKRKNKR